MPSGRMEQWTDVCPDGMALSSRRLTGNRKSFDLQNLLKHFGIAKSPVKQHLYIQVILSKKNEANYNLTNSPFGHSGTKIT
jgi:hypothetical protein